MSQIYGLSALCIAMVVTSNAVRKEQKSFAHAGKFTLNIAASCTHEPNEIYRLMLVSAG